MNAAVPLALRGSVAVVGRTWRVSVQGGEHLRALRAEKRPFIFALWHAQLLPLIWLHRGVPTSIIVSNHRDGRYLAAVCRKWGYRIIDGSSSRGGATALRRMIRVLEGGGEVAVTPDGPRGPRFAVKGGIVTAAQRTGAPILPVAAVTSPNWELRSWDRFVVPRPFARVHVAYAPPMRVEAGDEGVAQAGERLKAHLDRLSRAPEC